MNAGFSFARMPTYASTGMWNCAVTGSKRRERLLDHPAGMFAQGDDRRPRREQEELPLVEALSPLVVRVRGVQVDSAHLRLLPPRSGAATRRAGPRREAAGGGRCAGTSAPRSPRASGRRPVGLVELPRALATVHSRPEAGQRSRDLREVDAVGARVGAGAFRELDLGSPAPSPSRSRRSRGSGSSPRPSRR